MIGVRLKDRRCPVSCLSSSPVSTTGARCLLMPRPRQRLVGLQALAGRVRRRLLEARDAYPPDILRQPILNGREPERLRRGATACVRGLGLARPQLVIEGGQGGVCRSRRQDEGT